MVGDRQDGHQRHASQLDAGDHEQDQLLRDPVGDHPAEQRGQQDADRACGRDDRELRRTAVDPDHLPDEGNHPDPGGEGLEGERDGQLAVGGVAERREGARQPAPSHLLAHADLL